MTSTLSDLSIYTYSENMVSRQIEGELFIVPIVAGICDAEDSLLTLNKTGKAIWTKIDGKTTLKEIIKKISLEFKVSKAQAKKDVGDFITTLLEKRMVVEV